MSTPAPPLAIVNYGPNDPEASTDDFPPGFPGGRALPSALLDQLTPTQTDEDAYHCSGNANGVQVVSNWVKVCGELREIVRIVNDEWVCFFRYPCKEGCTVRCVNIDTSYREVWYRRAMGTQELELHLVIPSGHGELQQVALHQQGWALNPQWCHRHFMHFLGARKDELVPAVVHVELQACTTPGGCSAGVPAVTDVRTETAVLTNGRVVVKQEGPGAQKDARTCIRNLDGAMVVYGAQGERLSVQEPKGQASGTITYWHKVGWDARDYELKRLMRNGTWKRDFEIKPGPNPKKRKQRPFRETPMTEEEHQNAEEEADLAEDHDGAFDEAGGAADYGGPDMDDRDAFYEANC